MATVLVCDGNPVERRILRMTLDLDGHRIAEASTSREALDILAKWTFDVVLLAMELPDGSGYGVLEETRLIPGREGIRIVAILEQDDDKGPVSSFMAGAADVLIRPYGAQDVRDVVARATSVEIDLRDTPQREAFEEAQRLRGHTRSE